RPLRRHRRGRQHAVHAPPHRACADLRGVGWHRGRPARPPGPALTSVHRPDSPARWRGAATALLTAALSVGAHVLAGGSTSGAGVSLVLVVAGTLGAVAAGAHRARRTPGLIGLLAAGQLLCHLVLAAAGHSHAAGGGLSPLMLGTHAV